MSRFPKIRFPKIRFPEIRFPKIPNPEISNAKALRQWAGAKAVFPGLIAVLVLSLWTTSAWNEEPVPPPPVPPDPMPCGWPPGISGLSSPICATRSFMRRPTLNLTTRLAGIENSVGTSAAPHRSEIVISVEPAIESPEREDVRIGDDCEGAVSAGLQVFA